MRSSLVHPVQPRSSRRRSSLGATGTALTNTSSSKATSSSSSAKLVELVLAPLLRVLLDHGDEAVGDHRQAWIIGVPVGGLDEVEVGRRDVRVFDLSALERHECRHLVRDLGGDEDPSVALHLDGPLRNVELAESVEVVDRLGR